VVGLLTVIFGKFENGRVSTNKMNWQKQLRSGKRGSRVYDPTHA